jgi:hypothetical protein
MDLKKRISYFFFGALIGIGGVSYFVKEINKNKPEEERITFNYGPDARTLKSIRVKPERYFSEQAQNIINTHNIDSIRIEYLLHESDVDFSESDTDRSKPCQTYKLNGQLKDMDVSLLIKRCDSSATFENITIHNKKN